MAPTKRSKVHPLPAPKHGGGEHDAAASSSATPDLQLMDVSQQIRSSASIHKYHGSRHAVLDGLNINDGTNINYQESKVSRPVIDDIKPAVVVTDDGEVIDAKVAILGSRLRTRRVPTVLKEKAIQKLVEDVKLKGGNAEKVSSVLLTSLEVDEMQMKELCEGISENGAVRCLDLHGQMISHYEGYQLGGALFSSPKLLTASLRSCVSRDDVLRSIGSNIGYSKSLTSIDLSGGFAAIGVSGSALLAVGLKRNRSLTDVNLSCNNLGTDGLLSVVSALSGHNRMKYLNVACNSIPPEGGTWLAQFLDQTHSMEVLDISHNSLDVAALQAVMSAGKSAHGHEKPGFFDDPLMFENMNMLMRVDASHNPIHYLLPRLGWAVGRAARLVSLNLSHCQISTGLHEFAEGLKGGGAGFLACTTLQHLNLAHNELKDDAVLPRWRYLRKTSWLQRLKQHTSLVQIDLRGNLLGNDAALSIVEALYTLQMKATKRGRAVTGFYPSCELICDDNFMCMELQRAVFFAGSNELNESRQWLQEYHRMCKEVVWIARKKTMQDLIDKGIYNTKSLLAYTWQSKPMLFLRFHTVKFFTGEPPVWWVQAQEAQKRKTEQLERLVRKMEEQEEAALKKHGLTRGSEGQLTRVQAGQDQDDADGGID